MAIIQADSPFPLFTDKGGDPLDGGFVYFGEPDLNPEESPKTVYYDAALTIATPQPLRTSNGYITRNGAPAAIYSDGAFSMTVRDRNGALVFYSPSTFLTIPDGVVLSVDNPKDVSALLADTSLTYATGQTGTVADGDFIRTLAEGFSYKVAASDATDHHVTTAGGVKLYAQSGPNGVDVRAFGAIGDESADATDAIQGVLDKVGNALIPSGAFRVDGTIVINTGNSIRMLGGAILNRTTDTANTDPVVWVYGSNGSIIGAGQTTSSIQTENRAPNGVVLVGHESMTVSHGNVNYNTLRDFRIKGSTQFGQTSGADDICLHIQNPQIGGLSVYFQNISGIQLVDANTGLYMRGWANANLINQLHGFRLGNVTQGGDTQAMIVCEGALDNAVSDIFFHTSPNSTGLYLARLDNTGTAGGVDHRPYANSWKGLVFEQTGASARAVVAQNQFDSDGSFFEVRPNVNNGSTLYDGFFDDNFFFGLGGNRDLGVRVYEREEANTTNANIFGIEHYLFYDNMTENLTYDVASISLTSGTATTIEMDLSSRSGSGLNFQGAAFARWECIRNQAGAVAVNLIMSDVSSGIRPCAPVISGSTVTFQIRVANNGTATATHDAAIRLRRRGFDAFSSLNETPVTGAAGTIIQTGGVSIGGASGATGYLSPLYLGTYALWVDSTGDLRIKASAPTSDTDGTVVGTQS